MKKITKILSVLVLVFACFAGVFSLGGCTGKKISYISLSNEIKTEYKLGESLDLNGAKLVLTYDDDTQNELIISSDWITGFNTDTVGERTLTITYKEKTIEKTYKVVKTLESASIKTTIDDEIVWNEALNLLNLKHYIMYETLSFDDEPFSSWLTVRDDDKYIRQSLLDDCSALYFEEIDSVWWEWKYSSSTERWTKNEPTGDLDETLPTLINYSVYCKYKDFKYDELTKTYKGSITMNETLYNSVILKFEDNKLVEITLENAYLSDNYDKVERQTSSNKIIYAEPAIEFASFAENVFEQASSNLFNANEFVATVNRFNSDGGTWNVYNAYIKNGNYVKEIEPSDPTDENAYIYELKTDGTVYCSKRGETFDSKSEFYESSYFYAFVNTHANISNQKIVTEGDDYKLTYNLLNGGSTYNVETIVGKDFIVKEIVVKENTVNRMKITYTYTDVPEITGVSSDSAE